MKKSEATVTEAKVRVYLDLHEMVLEAVENKLKFASDIVIASVDLESMFDYVDSDLTRFPIVVEVEVTE